MSENAIIKEENRFDIRNNSLNTIRLLAAMSVMFIHGCNHLQVSTFPVIDYFLRYFYGVPIFFAMSGFLMWNSAGSTKGFVSYLKKRFWRIYPELWVGVAFELIVLIILHFKNINWAELAAFTVTQSTVLQFWTPDSLRSYGCGTPNGSLWTICVLIQFYIAVYFLRKLLHGRKLTIWIPSVILSSAIAVISPYTQNFLPDIIYKLYNQTLVPYLWLFVLGAFISEYREKIVPVLKKFWYIPLALSIITMVFSDFDLIGGPYNYGILRCSTLVAAVLGIAYQFPKLNIKTDISYGIYIYHMTVINAFIVFGLKENQLYLWIAMIISCILAYLSTRYVGAIAISKKSKV